MVLFNHTKQYGYELYTVTNDPFSYWLSIVSAVLCKAGVPLFMMVSGALLLGKNESVRTVIKKRVLPFSVIFVVMYLLQYLRIVRSGTESFSILGYVQYLFSRSPIITYWFLRSYLIYLLSLPVLRLIAEHMTDDVFFLLIGVELFFLISGVITTATGFQISFGFPFHDVFVFCPLAGYYLSKKKDLFTKKACNCIFGYCNSIGSSVYTSYVSEKRF